MTSSPSIDVSLPPHLYAILLPLNTAHLLPEPLSSELNAVLSKYALENYDSTQATDLTTNTDPDTNTNTEPDSHSHSRNTIPHSLLHSLSVWARSSEGSTALTRAGLSPSSYGIVSLLAGTQTQTRGPALPLRPALVDSSSSAGGLGREDRRAIVALVNALVSIAGSGAAGWWAAGGLGWRDEWVG